MHSVIFKNCENSWKNALPLGNGCMGAMAFYKDNCLSLPINHYEIYYNIGENVLPKDQLQAKEVCETPGAVHISYHERALRNQPKEGEPFYSYRLDKDGKQSYAVAGFSGSYPSTGEVELLFSEEMKSVDSLLELKLAEAKVKLEIEQKAGRQLRTETYVARKDVLLTKVRQSVPGLLRKIRISYPQSRDREYPEITYIQVNDYTFAYTVHMRLGKSKTFEFAGVLRLVGAIGILEDNEITLCTVEEEFALLVGIFTQWRYTDPLKEGIQKMEEYVASITSLEEEHRRYWQGFFGRSAISIPDKFLERVYYINQYALDCASGRDGIMKHHACGLNGLWDIRHPNLWGSMWYWDVNIQAAFVGVFSSNRLDLGKVFSDGLLTYVELAERYAKDIHNLPGAAIDYPYAFYYSTWPWCAQYLWFQYEYSQDKDYLRKDAYPLFLKLCRFAVELFRFDEERGEYVVFPDISPEQGPLAHNTVITVACVKYMLKFTMEAAEILYKGEEIPKEEKELLEKCLRLYEGLPAYPTVTDDYGKRFLDSEDAPANLWIRHPSVLMPIFPTGEINLDSDPELVKTAENTLTFLEEHCEIGVFQVSWLAAVSARLGNGQKALRLLYEMGLDHLIRSNGLAAEENERFINYCLIMRQPLYYPCMMEFTGEMLAAVNEMLLQSDGGIIRVFPAMPDGNPEYDRLIRSGYSLHEYEDRYNQYPAWKDASFDKLLARGAFEISAHLEDSCVTRIRVNSRVGGRVKITSPFSLEQLDVFCEGKKVAFDRTDNILSFETEAGKVYDLCADTVISAMSEERVFTGEGRNGSRSTDDGAAQEVLSHMTYTKRRIFIGEDEDTAYYKSIDSFVRDWYLGNVRMENHTVYKFDLGESYKKDYNEDLFRQSFAAEKMLLRAMNFVRLDELAFSVRRGYGFDRADGLAAVDRGEPDTLRRDFVEGEGDAEFYIEAPRGQYELLVVSGDACEESVTVLEAIGGRKTGGEIVKAGQYQCSLIPVIHEQDGKITLKISTANGYKWKLNLLFLNLYKQF